MYKHIVYYNKHENEIKEINIEEGKTYLVEWKFKDVFCTITYIIYINTFYGDEQMLYTCIERLDKNYGKDYFKNLKPIPTSINTFFQNINKFQLIDNENELKAIKMEYKLKNNKGEC